MIIVPVITSDSAKYDEIAQLLQESASIYGTTHINDVEQAIDFLSVEMPELAIVDFSDARLDTKLLLQLIKKDTWLLNTGIVGICSSSEALRSIDCSGGINILVLIEEARMRRKLPRIANIICHNRHMLLQRVIGKDFGSNIPAVFELQNDPVEATCLTNFICNYLFYLNRVDASGKDQLSFVLIELLVNAIEHGNCGISYKEKTDWLEHNSDICDLIDQKLADPNIAGRKVFLQCSVLPERSIFKITDEGSGFDWKSVVNARQELNSLELHGRGVILSREMSANLSYNELGNEVGFEFIHQHGISNFTPAIFTHLDKLLFNAGDTIFNQGDAGDHLYYIVSGSYDVFAGTTKIATLTQDDIFLGEMSFLLNSHRSATIKSVSGGCLIKISKRDFVEAVKKKPHYALFLSRLLARRIESSNLRVGFYKT